MPRLVLDCNVFVSALLSPEGAPALILDRWADEDFDLVVSPLLLAELEDVLGRPESEGHWRQNAPDASR